MIRGLFLVAAWFLVFPAVVNLAGAWESQTHPTPGVQVAFTDGSSAVGWLSRGWDRRWRLVTAEGTSRTFSEEQFTAMSYPAPVASRATEPGMPWRALAPPLATGFIFLLATFWPWFQAARQKDSHD